MSARAATLFTFSALAAANILPRSTPASQCNVGHLYCCNSLVNENDPSVALLVLLGIILGPGDFLVGLTCTPISILGVGGSSCSAQPACCTGTDFNGLVVLGCIPIDLNL